MKLVNENLGIYLQLEEDNAIILVIESPKLRLAVSYGLIQQADGGDGAFVLSEKGQILKISKLMNVVQNPFALNLNVRNVNAKLYQEIQNCGNENFYGEKEDINRQILEFFDKIMLNVPYNITSSLELNLAELCKLYSVQIENSSDNLLEQLINYIQVMNQLCGYRVFALMNFKMYLEDNDLKYLYEYASYQKVYLLLIEYIAPQIISGEKCCIIDKDGCIINIDKGNLQHQPSVKFGDNLDEFEV